MIHIVLNVLLLHNFIYLKIHMHIIFLFTAMFITQHNNNNNKKHKNTDDKNK